MISHKIEEIIKSTIKDLYDSGKLQNCIVIVTGSHSLDISKNIETDLCPVCSGAGRDPSVIMAVEKEVDLEKIEKKGNFRGKDFVLGGLLSFAGKGILHG